jgi:hypothetical protein
MFSLYRAKRDSKKRHNENRCDIQKKIQKIRQAIVSFTIRGQNRIEQALVYTFLQGI